MRHEALIGRKVAGRFTITRFLGEGGMASVFVAERDAEPRRVALKIMNPEFTADRAFVRRFQREAKAAARVKHPNSVKIFEYGIEGSLSYIVMELLIGGDLYALLERHGAISQGRAARILAEVCDALVVAHEMGVIHRDLKPENIMIIEDPTHPHGERVKVLDFGIAKILDSASPGDDSDPRVDPMSVVTRAGTFVGTPAYMSPEQCGLLPIDTRADIYTCGVLLFQLVTGRLPFEGETPLHTATLHIHAPVPSPAVLAPMIDPRLETLIMKALSKKPSDRHQTARHLGASLRKILGDLVDVAVGVGPISRRQTSSVLPREVLPGTSTMATLPPMPPLPRVLSSLEELPDSSSGVSIESARTLVSGPEGGPPPAVLLHSEPPPHRLAERRSTSEVGKAELAAWTRQSVPEISLQLPSWPEGIGNGLAPQSGASDSKDDRGEGEDESTLTMLRSEELSQDLSFEQGDVLSLSGMDDGSHGGREVKATLRSAADFGLSVPERKAEIGVVSAIPPAYTAPTTPHSPVLQEVEGARKRRNSTLRMSSPNLQAAASSLAKSTLASQPEVGAVGSPLQTSGSIGDVVGTPTYRVSASSVQVSPVSLPLDSAAQTSLALASTLVAAQLDRPELTTSPHLSAALPDVHLVRAPERSWLMGKRGLLVAFVAGMAITALLTALLMVLYIRFGRRG